MAHTLPAFFSTNTATTEIYTLSLHDALPISPLEGAGILCTGSARANQSGLHVHQHRAGVGCSDARRIRAGRGSPGQPCQEPAARPPPGAFAAPVRDDSAARQHSRDPVPELA